jgi:hypothetical protein
MGVCALVTAAAGMPLLAVVVLALIISAWVFRLLEQSVQIGNALVLLSRYYAAANTPHPRS